MDSFAKLPAERQAKINARAARMIAHDRTLRELRKTLKLTQADIAKAMGVTQNKISLLEQREDALVSTLRSAAAALGGELSLVITFRDGERVALQGFGEKLKKGKRSAKARKPTAVKEKALAAGSLNTD